MREVIGTMNTEPDLPDRTFGVLLLQGSVKDRRRRILAGRAVCGLRRGPFVQGTASGHSSNFTPFDHADQYAMILFR